MKIKLTKKNKIPEGWAIHYDNGIKEFDPSKLELHLEPEQKKGYIAGDILAERLKETSPNLAMAQWFLDNPKKIPKDWFKDEDGNPRYIFFWGTIVRGSDGDLHAPCLIESVGKVVLSWRWVDSVWGSGSPALRFSKSALDTKSLKPALNPLVLKNLEKIEDLILEIKGLK